jgi:hypothetical protein
VRHAIGIAQGVFERDVPAERMAEDRPPLVPETLPKRVRVGSEVVPGHGSHGSAGRSAVAPVVVKDDRATVRAPPKTEHRGVVATRPTVHQEQRVSRPHRVNEHGDATDRNLHAPRLRSRPATCPHAGDRRNRIARTASRQSPRGALRQEGPKVVGGRRGGRSPRHEARRTAVAETGPRTLAARRWPVRAMRVAAPVPILARHLVIGRSKAPAGAAPSTSRGRTGSRARSTATSNMPRRSPSGRPERRREPDPPERFVASALGAPGELWARRDETSRAANMA